MYCGIGRDSGERRKITLVDTGVRDSLWQHAIARQKDTHSPSGLKDAPVTGNWRERGGGGSRGGFLYRPPQTLALSVLAYEDCGANRS